MFDHIHANNNISIIILIIVTLNEWAAHNHSNYSNTE